MGSWVVWTIVAAAFTLGELHTNSFYLAPFAVGGAIAGRAGGGRSRRSGGGHRLCAAAILFLLLLRPLRRAPAVRAVLRTGAAALIGQPALVMERIANARASGRLKIGGEVWTARAYDEEQVIAAASRSRSLRSGAPRRSSCHSEEFHVVALIVVAVLVVVALGIAARTIRIIPQARAAVLERLGRYHRTLEPGLTFVTPFIDRVRPLIDLREQVVNFSPQPVITEDNVVVAIETVLYFTIIDAKSASYEIANPLQAIEQLTVTTLRNVIGGLTLEQR